MGEYFKRVESEWPEDVFWVFEGLCENSAFPRWEGRGKVKGFYEWIWYVFTINVENALRTY